MRHTFNNITQFNLSVEVDVATASVGEKMLLVLNIFPKVAKILSQVFLTFTLYPHLVFSYQWYNNALPYGLCHRAGHFYVQRRVQLCD